MHNIIKFITEVDKLKNVHRKTLTYHEDRYENSAEHSWHLALAVMVFAGKANTKIDIQKCIKMAILHDIVEIDAGDTIVYAKDDGKFDRELEAAKRIFGLLPKELANDFIETWVEFEKKETEEAKFVGALDRFLPLYSNVLNEGHSWQKHDVKLDQILEINKEAITRGSSQLWEEVDQFLEDCLEKGHLKK